MDLESIWDQVDSLRVEDPPVKLSGTFYVCLCGGLKDTHESDLPTCMECGRCDNEFISDEPEWRGGIDDDGGVRDPSRVGAPVDERYSEMWSMGTIMTLRSNASYNMKKLARINFHTSMNHKDRSLFHDYADIERSAKDLPKCVIRDAQELYRTFGSKRLTRGAVRTGIKANCLLQACKNNNVSRSIAEIAESFGIPTKDVSRTQEIFHEVFPVEQNKIVMASDVASRLMNSFELPDEVKRRVRMRVIQSCERIQEMTELAGKTPKTIAATVIRVLIEEWVDLNTVCSVCGISAPTIKKIELVVRNLLKN